MQVISAAKRHSNHEHWTLFPYDIPIRVLSINKTRSILTPQTQTMFMKSLDTLPRMNYAQLSLHEGN